MERIAEAEFIRDFFHRGIRYQKPLDRDVHFQTHQVLVGTLVKSLEEPAQICDVDVTLLGNLIETLEGQAVLSNEFSGTLTGGKGFWCACCLGCGGLGDLQDQLLKDRCT